jgi:hypothetical protein
MKKLFLLIFLLLISQTVFATESSDLMVHSKNNFVKTIAKFESAILKLNKRLKPAKATRLATLIAIESKKSKLDPRLLLAILSTESSFHQEVVSPTHDISIAQINLKSWSPKKFKERTGYDLDPKRLKKEEAYAISRMCLILLYLKDNYGDSDKWWFARYHSATPQYKKDYIRQLTARFKILKPFGNTLLKDMPPIEHLAKMRTSGSELAMASYLEK